jgi:hypothetical protein
MTSESNRIFLEKILARRYFSDLILNSNWAASGIYYNFAGLKY